MSLSYSSNIYKMGNFNGIVTCFDSIYGIEASKSTKFRSVLVLNF